MSQYSSIETYPSRPAPMRYTEPSERVGRGSEALHRRIAELKASVRIIPVAEDVAAPELYSESFDVPEGAESHAIEY